jgi:hypothetical protein
MPQELHANACCLLTLPIQFLPLAPEHTQTLLALTEPVGTLSVNPRLEFPNIPFHLGYLGLHFSHPCENRLLVAGERHEFSGAPIRGKELLAGRAGFFCL